MQHMWAVSRGKRKGLGYRESFELTLGFATYEPAASETPCVRVRFLTCNVGDDDGTALGGLGGLNMVLCVKH